ncbi:MAG TPA: choice-of-anchor K domain-containing protein, partial [Actinomycetota bacterium]|nr:choice-of-anchor K domain-containing protein [Actinomycetota bacterium]
MKSASRFGLSSMLAVAFLSIFLAVPAAAVNANVNSEGSFSDPVGDGAGSVLVCGPDPRCPSGPESQIRWGQSTGSGTSGLGFQGTNSVVSNENPFAVGTLTHFNNPTADGT